VSKLPAPQLAKRRLVKGCPLLALRGTPAALPPPAAWASGRRHPALEEELWTGRDRRISERFELEGTFKDPLVQPPKMEAHKVLGWQRDLHLSRLH